MKITSTSRTFLSVCILPFLIPVLATLPGQIQAQNTYVVNSTDGDDADINPGDGTCDTGQLNSITSIECTLRAAIEEANAVGGADSIHFDIPSLDPGCAAGVCTITPDSVYDFITSPLTIDGRTQHGSDCQSKALKIVLDGQNAAGNGLEIRTDNSAVLGMVVHSFSRAASRRS